MSRKVPVISSVLAYIVVAAACSGQNQSPSPEHHVGAGGAKSGPNLAWQAVPSSAESGETKSLLAIPYGDSIVVEVMQHADGQRGVVVTGKLGEVAPSVGRDLLTKGIGALFREQYPGVPVPAFVDEVDAEAHRPVPDGAGPLVPDLNGGTGGSSTAGPAPSGDGIHVESLSGFCSNACVTTMTYPPDYMICTFADECDYETNYTAICTYAHTAPDAVVSFAWNESGSSGTHSNSYWSGTYTVPAWTWQYGTWSTAYSGSQYYCLTLGSGSGNLGITWHNIRKIYSVYCPNPIYPTCPRHY